MRKILISLFFIFPIAGIAQTPFLNKVKNRTKNQVEQRALNKIDKEVDKALDEIESPSSGKNSNANTTDARANPKAAPLTKEGKDVTAYSKYDFVPVSTTGRDLRSHFLPVVPPRLASPDFSLRGEADIV